MNNPDDTPAPRRILMVFFYIVSFGLIADYSPELAMAWLCWRIAHIFREADERK